MPIPNLNNFRDNAVDLINSLEGYVGLILGNGDAFGRLRVSEPATLFDSQLQYDKQPLLWDEKTAGSGSSTHVPNESSVEMDVTTANGDSVIRQTYEYFRYQPGKSQLILCTFVFGPQQDGTTKLVGYGDTNNGVFIGQDGGGAFVLLRSNNTGTVSDERKIYQSNWNLDTFSETDGITLDFTKTQILVVDLEWLGVGRVRLGLNIDGITYYFHEFLNANVLDKVYMTTANLPIRYEITNTQEVAAASTLKHICSTVISEGGAEKAVAFPFSTEITDVAIGNGVENKAVVLALRPSLLLNGIENHSKFIPKTFEVLAVGGPVFTKVIYNPTITGGTWSSVDSSSATEVNSTVASYTGGIEIATSLTPSGSARSGGVLTQAVTDKLPFGLGIDEDSPTTIALAAYTNTANVSASFSFNWEEVR